MPRALVEVHLLVDFCGDSSEMNISSENSGHVSFPNGGEKKQPVSRGGCFNNAGTSSNILI